ncbi:bifunctional salicylyl-CoA 5-hydroxylase/oxidoreductase [candidate division KSB1 bacterium]|nr:bifunctional salicylyl-CoA 5-hydroxylase/oxidoreductase [candidate division KSB1 bacterium]
MKVAIIGGGPAGLYFAIQMKMKDPSHELSIFERNERGNTYGWGVVFSDGTLDNLKSVDAETYTQITDAFVHWDDIDVHFGGKIIKSGGHGFSGISRQTLLEILTKRAEEVGVKIDFENDIQNDTEFMGADLIVAADGANSIIRKKYENKFKPDFDFRHCKYVWLGTRKTFGAFTFIFKETEFGWFQAHCYRFEKGMSTFIVECYKDVWYKAGIDMMSKEEGIEYCENLFAEYLDGHHLISNAENLRGSAVWMSFPRVNCENWYHNKTVLLGDAAATAHFSIGSGTKLALESAIALSNKIHEYDDLETALQNYQEERRIEVLRLQSAARNSTEWFEQVGLKGHLEPEQFAYSLITRSQRVSHENLRLRDKAYLENFEKWLGTKSTGREHAKAIPPMFLPFRIREMEIKNRVVCSPMAMYSAVDGKVTDFHFVHFGVRAMGGAGLLFTEMTCVSPDARITPGCAGLYSDEHTTAWKRIVDFVHQYGEIKFGLQIGHAGRKGSTKLGWEGYDVPLDGDNWPIYAPSPIPYTEQNQVPVEMTTEDMVRIKKDFVAATLKADEAGFDLLELHCAHGYLLSSFISPITNIRSDDFGGSLENRMRYPLEVFDAMRAVWPENKPMSVRISASDWVKNGITIDDSIEIAKMLKQHDVDIVDVSAGQVSPDQEPVYGRMYQVPFSERIRLEVGIATMAVGNIYEPDHVNSIIAAGRADLCLLARPHLWDPFWTLRAAAQLGYEDIKWPDQYLSGKQQLETLSRRARESQIGPI